MEANPPFIYGVLRISPRDFNGTVTCLIYEKFPGSNLRGVKARISLPGAPTSKPLDRTVGISRGGLLGKSIVGASSTIAANPRHSWDPSSMALMSQWGLLAKRFAIQRVLKYVGQSSRWMHGRLLCARLHRISP